MCSSTVSDTAKMCIRDSTNTLTDTINAPEAAVLNAATHDLDVLNALLALDGETFKSAAAEDVYKRQPVRIPG